MKIASIIEKLPLLIGALAILFSLYLVIGSVDPAGDSAKIDKARLDVQNLSGGLKIFYSKKGHYPTEEEGLQTLVKDRILDSLPTDPWDRPYIYVLDDHGPVIYSLGEDGRRVGNESNADIFSVDKR